MYSFSFGLLYFASRSFFLALFAMPTLLGNFSSVYPPVFFSFCSKVWSCCSEDLSIETEEDICEGWEKRPQRVTKTVARQREKARCFMSSTLPPSLYKNPLKYITPFSALWCQWRQGNFWPKDYRNHGPFVKCGNWLLWQLRKKWSKGEYRYIDVCLCVYWFSVVAYSSLWSTSCHNCDTIWVVATFLNQTICHCKINSRTYFFFLR